MTAAEKDFNRRLGEQLPILLGRLYELERENARLRALVPPSAEPLTEAHVLGRALDVMRAK